MKKNLGEREWGFIAGIGLAQYMDKWKVLVNEIVKFQVP
jgi:hypothetical protein